MKTFLVDITNLTPHSVTSQQHLFSVQVTAICFNQPRNRTENIIEGSHITPILSSKHIESSC